MLALDHESKESSTEKYLYFQGTFLVISLSRSLPPAWSNLLAPAPGKIPFGRLARPGFSFRQKIRNRLKEAIDFHENRKSNISLAAQIHKEREDP